MLIYMSKVVVSYSGGLDTSLCLPLLRDKFDFEKVIAVTVDVGQPKEEIEQAKSRAEELADKFYLIDAKEKFVSNYIFPSIKANGSYEGYVLGVAIARPLIAKETVEVAIKEEADALAHGCTGKGNDQARFDHVFRQAEENHKMDLVAPIRELNLTRKEEEDLVKKYEIELPSTKKYSIDQNLWTRSIEGGILEDPAIAPPEEIYEWTKSIKNALEDAQIIILGFENGVPVSLNDVKIDGGYLIKQLNEMGGMHGIGRTDMMENRNIGLKARENYEHPAATILLEGHADLEQLILTRDELRFKKFVDDYWSEQAYKGLIDSPFCEALNAYINKTQERVNGTVTMKLYKGNAIVIGRESPNELYSKEDVSFDEKSLENVGEALEIIDGGYQARKAKKN